MTVAYFFQVLLNGLVMGGIYALMAIGFTLIFGILRIVNFAHGEFYMFAAFIVYTIYGLYKFVGYLPAVLIAAVCMGLIGIFFERILFKAFRSAERELQGLIVAFALGIGMHQVAVLIWGADDLSIPPAYTGSVRFESLGLVFPLERLVVVIYSIIILFLFYLFLKKTKIGLAMEAVVQDKEAAEIQGISVDFVYAVSFGVGTCLAALAGGLVGPIFALNPHMGLMPMMTAFMATILGGLGNIPGAVLGALIIGISESFLATYFGGAFAGIMIFVLIVFVLSVKPSGLLGQTET